MGGGRKLELVLPPRLPSESPHFQLGLGPRLHPPGSPPWFPFCSAPSSFRLSAPFLLCLVPVSLKREGTGWGAVWEGGCQGAEGLPHHVEVQNAAGHRAAVSAGGVFQPELLGIRLPTDF